MATRRIRFGPRTGVVWRHLETRVLGDGRAGSKAEVLKACSGTINGSANWVNVTPRADPSGGDQPDGGATSWRIEAVTALHLPPCFASPPSPTRYPLPLPGTVALLYPRRAGRGPEPESAIEACNASPRCHALAQAHGQLTESPPGGGQHVRIRPLAGTRIRELSAHPARLVAGKAAESDIKGLMVEWKRGTCVLAVRASYWSHPSWRVWGPGKTAPAFHAPGCPPPNEIVRAER